MCNAEMTALLRRDLLDRLVLVDASAPDFVAPAGADRVAMMTVIHGSTADGRLTVGVETLRLAYEAVGLGWLAAPTTWPLLRGPAEHAYRWIARHRYAMPRWLSPLFVTLYKPRGAHRAAAIRRQAERARCTDTSCPL